MIMLAVWTLMLLCFIKKGLQIEVLVDGEFTDNSRFCVGDNVTFVCPIPDRVYQWIVDSPFLSNENGFIRLTNSSVTVQRGPFILKAEDNNNLGRISSINVVVFESLGTAIGCLGLESGRQQSLFIDVVDLPSAPMLEVEVDEDYETFIITILPPEKGAICVTQYMVNVTDNVGIMYTGSVSVEKGQSNVTVDIRDVIDNTTLDICKRRYKFQVAANNGEWSPPISPTIDFSGIGDISSVKIVGDSTVEWSVSDSLKECVINYLYTLDLTNQSRLLNSTNNQMPVTDFGPPKGDCNVDDITIIPIIPAMDEPLFNNSATDRVFLVQPFSILPTVVDSTFTSLTVQFQVSINECPGGQIEASIVPITLDEPLQFRRVPLNTTEIEFTSLNASVEDFFCTFAVLSANLGVFYSKKILCRKNISEVEASIVDFIPETKVGGAIGLGVGAAVAIFVLAAMSGVALAYIINQYEVMKRMLKVRACKGNRSKTINTTLAELRSGDNKHSKRGVYSQI